MSIAVQITVKDEGVLAALSRLAMTPENKSALLDEIGISLAENTRLRFGDQTSPEGQAWKPSIRAQKQGGETLRDTGRLMNSITHRVSSDSVEVGTKVAYAAMMHFGGTIRATGGGYLKFRIGNAWVQKRSVTIPARPFLGLDAADTQEVISLIDHFLKART